MMGVVRRYRLVVTSFTVLVVVMAVACGGSEATPTAQSTATQVPLPSVTSIPATPSATLAPTVTRAAATATNVPPTASVATFTPTASKPQPKVGGTLRAYISSNPSTMDLHLARSSANWGALLPVMNYLLQNWQFGGTLTPDLAKSREISADGLTYTFNLNSLAKWQDGRSFTADDVIYNLDRLSGKLDLAAPYYGSVLTPVKSYQKLSDSAVKVSLARQDASFLPALGAIGVVMYPKGVAISEFRDMRPIGTGPFRLTSFGRDVKVTFERNKDYWKKDELGRALPYLEKMDLFIITDNSAAYAAFRTNQTDIINYSADVLSGRVDQARQAIPGLQVATYYLAQGFQFNNKGAFVDQRLRSAFQLAINRVDINRLVFQGDSVDYSLYSTIGSKWALPEGEIKKLPGFNPDTRAQDVARANQLLDGFLTDKGLTRQSFTPELVVSNQVASVSTAVTVQQQLKQLLGLNLKLRVVELAVRAQIEQDRSFEIINGGPPGILPDPSQELGHWMFTGDPTNIGGWSDPNVDKLAIQIDAELNEARRLDLAHQLERLAYELAWDLTLPANPRPIAARPEVKGPWQVLSFGDAPPNMRETIWLDR